MAVNLNLTDETTAVMGKDEDRDNKEKAGLEAHKDSADYKKAIDLEHLKGQFALILAHLGHEHAKAEASITAREAD